MSEYFLYKGKKFVQIIDPPLPDGSDQPVGTVIRTGDGQMFGIVIHDWPEMRDTGAGLSFTNEIFVPRPIKLDGTVDSRSKITMQLAKQPIWWDRMVEINGQEIMDRFEIKGFGWMDFLPPNENKAFNMLSCGGNRVKVIGQSGNYYVVETQNFLDVPSPYSYVEVPYLYIKQVLVFHTAEIRIGWMVDKGEKGYIGDLYIPFVIDEFGAALQKNQISIYPPLPFSTTWHGIPVVFTQFCFSGSDTWGYVNERGWYPIDIMQVIGDPSDRSKGGTNKDRILHIDPIGWPWPCPPPVIGWQRGR